MDIVLLIMDNTDENKQTAFTNFGIPKGEEDVAATDSLSEFVEAFMDNIEKDATGEIDAEEQSESK